MFPRVFRLEPHFADAGASHRADVDLVGVLEPGFPPVVDDRRGEEVKLHVRGFKKVSSLLLLMVWLMLMVLLMLLLVVSLMSLLILFHSYDCFC